MTARKDFPAEPIAASGAWSIRPDAYNKAMDEIDDWRSKCDQRVREACLKAGLDQGREEQVDRKGEPLPTAKEIMDRVAEQRRVNYDGSRVDESVAKVWAVGVVDV